MNFILGGVQVELVSATDFTESFSRVSEGSVRHRTQNGTLKNTQHWRKTSIAMSGGGHIPFGLSDLDYSQQLELSFGSRRSITSASNIIVIPSARRIDVGYEPKALAIFANRAEQTSLALVTDTATLTTVAGAIAYQVQYYPKLTVLAEQPEESFSRSNADWRWSFSAEEI